MKVQVAGLALSIAALASGAAAAEGSSVYCKPGVPAFEFAGRINPDGSLVFGLSVWDVNGDNSFIHGAAVKQGDHWLYVSRPPAGGDRPCRLRIWYRVRGGVTAKADAGTGCANHHGWSRVVLSRTAYQGPVTVELDDPSNFFEDPPGLLGKGDCAKRNLE
jgi:hypothetical protein